MARLPLLALQPTLCVCGLAVASGAVGALYGPLHGGANEAVLRMLQARGPDVVGLAGAQAGQAVCAPAGRVWRARRRQPSTSHLPAQPPRPPCAFNVPFVFGASRPCLQRIGSVENVGPFLEGVKNRKERMFGFGHR